jgi:hypothetical protein
MSDVPKKPKAPASIIQTRTQSKLSLTPPNTSKSQALSPGGTGAKKKLKKDATPQKPKSPSKTDASSKESGSGYVCEVCKNSELIRNARLKLESDLIINKLDNFGSIKESISDSLSTFENIDLHLQHLITTTKFDQYQSKVEKIEIDCKTLVDEIAKLTLISNTSTNSQVQTLSDNDLSKIISGINSSSDSMNDLSAKFDQLQTSVDRFVIPSTLGKFACGSRPPPNVHGQPAPDATPPAPACNPAKAYEDYVQKFVSQDMSTDLTTFLSSTSFAEKKGRAVAAFGQVYTYTGSGPPKSTPIPEPIKKLIERIETDYPDHGINSCVVNRYSGSESFLVEHQDNEKDIRAGSNIFSVSLGSTTTLKFRDWLGESEKTLSIEGDSLYVMSQPSQYYWKHRIDNSEHDTESLRYSITLRSVHKSNKNSTIILGDSNTRFLLPTDSAIFGKDMTGHRELTFHIREINPELCAGYQNIVVHTGINDINEYSKGREETDPPPDDVDSHFALLVNKLNEIQRLCPYARLIVSPILPTKLPYLNARAMKFNNLLFDYADYHQNITTLNFSPFLCQQTSLLNKQFATYKNSKHPIHLGRQGICMLGGMFKDAVFRRKVDGRGYNSVVAGRSYALSFPPLDRS